MLRSGTTACAGYDGHKRKRGSKTHIAVDTLGHLMDPAVWRAFLPGHCPAYISVEQYEQNQTRLAANRARAETTGAVRTGAALLPGLVVCARCQVRLSVH
jgi:hypothetical protein